MKKILIPTDFSTTAEHAFFYVKKLAQDIDSDLTLMNVYHSMVDNNDPIQALTLKELAQIRQERLDQFVGGKSPETGYDNVITDELIAKEVRPGFAAEEIVKISQTNAYDLIAMGTSGEGGIISKMFGSISISVAQKAACPILLIPPGAEYNGIKKMAFASNYQSTDQEMIDQVIDFAGEFEADIRFVHVNETKQKGDYEVEELLLEQIIRKNKPAAEFRVHTVHSPTIWEGLFEYGQKEEIDLIVLVTKKRKFLEDLFHQSITKRLALNDKNIPLLVLHHK